MFMAGGGEDFKTWLIQTLVATNLFISFLQILGVRNFPLKLLLKYRKRAIFHRPVFQGLILNGK